MMKRATALLVLLALCGLLPVAAQEPQEDAAVKAKKMADDGKEMVDDAKEMVDDAKKMVDDTEKMVDDAKGMVDDAEKKADDAKGMVDDAKGMVDDAEKPMDSAKLEEVLAAHYEALGGTEAWSSIEAVRFEGTMSMGPGMEAPFKMTMKRPDYIRLEFTFQGMTGIQASDGTVAWMVMPFMGKNTPEEMPADMAKQLKEQADIDGPLFDWANKGHKVELLGKEEMEGTDVYKVKLTRDNGDVRYHYLDSDHYVTIKQEGKTKVQGQEMDIETAIGDYKERCLATSMEIDEEHPCEGPRVILPHAIESKPKGAPAGQAITIESVAINPADLAEDYFAMPAKEETTDEAEAESGE